MCNYPDLDLDPFRTKIVAVKQTSFVPVSFDLALTKSLGRGSMDSHLDRSRIQNLFQNVQINFPKS